MGKLQKKKSCDNLKQTNLGDFFGSSKAPDCQTKPRINGTLHQMSKKPLKIIDDVVIVDSESDESPKNSQETPVEKTTKMISVNKSTPLKTLIQKPLPRIVERKKSKPLNGKVNTNTPPQTPVNKPKSAIKLSLKKVQVDPEEQENSEEILESSVIKNISSPLKRKSPKQSSKNEKKLRVRRDLFTEDATKIVDPDVCNEVTKSEDVKVSMNENDLALSPNPLNLSQTSIKIESSQNSDEDQDVCEPVPSTSTDNHSSTNAQFDVTYNNVNLEEYGISLSEFADHSEAPDITLQDDSSEDITSLKELHKIMDYVSSSPNLYFLLYQEEKDILTEFFNLPKEYKYFTFKLFTRLPKWYNVTKFVSDIKLDVTEYDKLKILQTLADKNIIDIDYLKEDPVNLLDTLLLPDVKDIYKSYKIKVKAPASKLKKNEIIEAIIGYCSRQSTLSTNKTSKDILLEKIQVKMGTCMKLKDNFHETLFRLHLLYSFTNWDLMKPYDLYMFMRSSAGKIPRYSIDCARIFISREEFKRFATAAEFYKEYLIAKEALNKELMLRIADDVFNHFCELISSDINDEKGKVSFHQRFTAKRVYIKLLEMARIDFTKETEKLLTWLPILLKHTNSRKKGLMYDQLAMKHFQNEDILQAGDIIIEGLCDPKISEVGKYDLSKRAQRYVKKLKKVKAEHLQLLEELLVVNNYEPPSTLIQACEITENGGRKLYLEKNGPQNVESVAINYYADAGYPRGIHCEGSLIVTLFILLFWDLIFDVYIPGTFICEIQTVPLDLYSEFYQNRKKDVDKRLEDIMHNWSEVKLEDFLVGHWAQYGSLETITSKIILNDLTILTQSIECIGKEILGNILKRLVTHFSNHRAGMPDLFVWNPFTNKCKFVEVKSDNDTLSSKQILWLEYLSSIGANVEVCHVNSIGTKPKKGLRK